MRTKTCPTCVEKPITEFGRNCQSPDGLHYYCKACAALRQKQWRLENPEKARQSRAKYLQQVRALNQQRNPYGTAELSPT